MMQQIDAGARLESLLGGGAYERAWRYCLSLCRQPQEAQDLLQDALALALLRLNSLRDETRFAAWLLSIVRRRFIDLRRRRRLTETLEPGSLLAEAAAGTDTEIGDPALLGGLLALPARLREVLELHYLHGLSLAEAAQVLRVSPAAARQLLYRARTALRRRLEDGTLAGPAQAGALKEGRE